MAYKVRHTAASKGFIVLTGGLSRVMEHTIHGAKDAGGLTIGIIPSYDKSSANKYCDIVYLPDLNTGAISL